MAEMIYISDQWLAILLSAVLVWIGSALVWMVSPHHKKDFAPLPDEDAALDALRPQNLKPGIYNIPHCQDWNDAKKKAFRALNHSLHDVSVITYDYLLGRIDRMIDILAQRRTAGAEG